MSRLLLACLLIAWSFPCQAAKRPLRYDDFLQTTQVVDAAPSPNGEAIVAQVKRYDAKAGAWRHHLELIRPDGAVRLTGEGASASEPTWSPDGREVAFLSSRDGGAAIWRIAVDGGEARKVVDLPLGGDSLVWLPAGRGFLISTEVFEDCGADLACSEERLEEREASGVSAMVFDDLLYRPWSRWRDGRVRHLLQLDPADGSFTDLTPGSEDVPLVPFGGRHELSVSGDGRYLAFAIKSNEAKAWRTHTRLVELDLKTGTRRDVPGLAGYNGHPAWSPDGRSLAFVAQARDGYEADRMQLMVWRRGQGAPRAVTASFDLWSEAALWSPDGKHLYFPSADHGRRAVYRVKARGGAPERVAWDGFLDPKGFVRWKKQLRLVATWQSFSRAPRLALLDPRREREPQAITSYNQRLFQQIDFARVEEVNIPVPTAAAPERKVHAFLLTPQAEAKAPRPLFVLIHGGPQGAWLDRFHARWNAQLFAGFGYPALLINPAGSTGYGQAFIEEVSRDWGGQPYDDIMAVVDAVARLPGIDGQRVCAAGGSYGGFMANWIEGHTDRFRCLVSHAGVAEQFSMYGATDELWFPEWEFGGTPWTHAAEYEKWSPTRYAEHFSTPMLVIHGANDMRVPLEQGLQMFTLLKRRGVDARLIVYPDETHFVLSPSNARFWYGEVEAWLRRYLERAP